jgi:serine/threonine-protein kinase
LNASNPVFSPDGERLAFLSGIDVKLQVMPVTGGPPMTLAAPGVGAGGGPAWGADGWIYFDALPGYHRIRPEGGTPELVVPLDSATRELGLAWPEVLPNGKGLLLRSRHSLVPADYDLIAYEFATGTRHVLTKGLVARYVAPGHLVFVRADGAVFAAPFDQDRFAFTGPAVPVLDGVMTKPFGAVDFAVSSAGTLAYAPGRAVGATGVVELVTLSRDGAVRPLEPPVTFNPSGSRALSLSPDGRRLVFDIIGTGGVDLWVKQLPSGPLSRLTFSATGALRPRWMHDGAHVLYLARAQDSVPASVWRQRADGSSAPEEIWRVPGQQVAEAFTSADGEWLIYRVAGSGGDRDSYAVRLGRDTAPVPLLTGPQNEFGLALSPDGRWLAYASPESGRDEIYVRPFPNVGDGRWQVSTDGGVAALWSHSGRELFYQATNGDLMAVPISPGPTFAPGDARRLLPFTAGTVGSATVPYYAVTPDDSEFIMVRQSAVAQEPGGGQLVVVDNWLDELRAKLRGK